METGMEETGENGPGCPEPAASSGRSALHGLESICGIGFHTLDDFSVRGRTVLLRIDINSPVDEKTLRLVDGSKIRSSVPTIRELMDRCARIVILAHQGRPGDYDFIPLNEHAAFLTQYLGRRVKYIDDLLGKNAIDAIQGLSDSECIMLKNVREFSGEQEKRTPEEHAKSELVRVLAPMFDLFVNDAFASSHRSHASLVGFTTVLPSAAGRLMENEVKTLTRVFHDPERPSTFIFGGTKFVDALPVIEKLADRTSVDNIIIAGLAGYSFLWILGKRIGTQTEKLAGRDVTPEIAERARQLYQRHRSKIHLPVDGAIDIDGQRKEFVLDALPDDARLMDIGTESIRMFDRIVLSSKTIFLSGPPGVFEKEEFSKGTSEMLEAMTESEAFSCIGGGHSSAAANKFGVHDRISYISTGGGALERLMLGREMPVVEALRASAKRF